MAGVWAWDRSGGGAGRIVPSVNAGIGFGSYPFYTAHPNVPVIPMTMIHRFAEVGITLPSTITSHWDQPGNTRTRAISTAPFADMKAQIDLLRSYEGADAFPWHSIYQSALIPYREFRNEIALAYEVWRQGTYIDYISGPAPYRLEGNLVKSGSHISDWDQACTNCEQDPIGVGTPGGGLLVLLVGHWDDTHYDCFLTRSFLWFPPMGPEWPDDPSAVSLRFTCVEAFQDWGPLGGLDTDLEIYESERFGSPNQWDAHGFSPIGVYYGFHLLDPGDYVNINLGSYRPSKTSDNYLMLKLQHESTTGQSPWGTFSHPAAPPTAGSPAPFYYHGLIISNSPNERLELRAYVSEEGDIGSGA